MIEKFLYMYKAGKEKYMVDFSKIDGFNKAPIRNQAVSDLNTFIQPAVNNNTGNQQNSNNNLLDNSAYRVLPARNNAIDNSNYAKMYSQLSEFLDKDGKKYLQTIHENKKLISNKSNNGSSTLENLYNIMTKPRAGGFDAKIILNETLKTLADPYIITQDFGSIPETIVPQLVSDENTRVQHKLEEEKIHPIPSYEKKEILKTITPVQTIKENAINLSNKLGVSLPSNATLADVLEANSKTIYNLQKQSTSNPQISQYQKENEALNQQAQEINFNKGHTCPAASIEFDLADKKPAEFVRYIENLTSPDKCVKTKIKYSNIADDMPAAISKLKDWKIDYQRTNTDTIEVTLRPDQNAFSRAIIQEYGRAKDSRSVVDSILQSTFMQVGSEKTYNSLTDLRSEDVGEGRGLNQEEGAFVESIVDYEGGKDSVTYMELDDNLTKINKYNFDQKTTEAQLTETLNRGKNVMVGFLTDIDEKGNLVSSNGHEVLLTGIVQDKTGEKFFKYNDTDDGDNYAPSFIKVSELIRTLHHANLPKDVIRKYIPPQKDARLSLISDYWQLKRQNALTPSQQKQA